MIILIIEFLLTILIFAIWYYRGYTERMERNRRRMSSFINPNPEMPCD